MGGGMIARRAETTSERGRGSQRELLHLLRPGEEDEQKSAPKFEQTPAVKVGSNLLLGAPPPPFIWCLWRAIRKGPDRYEGLHLCVHQNRVLFIQVTCCFYDI